MFGAECDDGGMIRRIERMADRVRRNAGVARRGMQATQQRRLREFPRKRMFATPGPQQQDVHGFPF